MAKLHFKIKTRNANDKLPIWNNTTTPNNNTTHTDYLTFSDDANIDLPNMNHLIRKLITYNNIATKYDYIIKWGKTEIPTNLISKQNKNIINKPPPPINSIKLTKES